MMFRFGTGVPECHPNKITKKILFYVVFLFIMLLWYICLYFGKDVDVI